MLDHLTITSADYYDFAANGVSVSGLGQPSLYYGTGISTIRVNAGSGNDQFTLHGQIQYVANAQGGSGDDWFYVGDGTLALSSAAILSGGPGNDRITFDDMLAAAQNHVRHTEMLGVPYAVVGYSFGGYLAGITASRAHKKPAAVVIAITPFVLRLPFSFRIVSWCMEWKSRWEKKFTSEEIRERRRMFYYNFFPGNSLRLIQKGNELLPAALATLSAPLLALSTEHDNLAAPESAQAIIAAAGKNPQSKAIIVPGRTHELFLGKTGQAEEARVIAFLKGCIK